MKNHNKTIYNTCLRGGTHRGRQQQPHHNRLTSKKYKGGEEALSDHVLIDSKNLPMKPYNNKREFNANLKNNVSNVLVAH